MQFLTFFAGQFWSFNLLLFSFLFPKFIYLFFGHDFSSNLVFLMQCLELPFSGLFWSFWFLNFFRFHKLMSLHFNFKFGFWCSFGPVFLQDSFDLPSDYFAQLPRDLRLDVTETCFVFIPMLCDLFKWYFWIESFW